MPHLRVLEFEINCGITTCVNPEGGKCKYLGTKRFGITPVCGLFRDEDWNEIKLKLSEDGQWRLRCDECNEKDHHEVYRD